jgi:nitroimidazol reductase NimA-like FMN-containing flavoprotein (pyridoxamine 5'-phosphate oxidase superfamily)
VTFLKTLEEKKEAVVHMVKQLEKNPEQKMATIRDERLNDTLFGRIDIEFMTGKQPEAPKSAK